MPCVCCRFEPDVWDGFLHFCVGLLFVNEDGLSEEAEQGIQGVLDGFKKRFNAASVGGLNWFGSES